MTPSRSSTRLRLSSPPPTQSTFAPGTRGERGHEQRHADHRGQRDDQRRSRTATRTPACSARIARHRQPDPAADAEHRAQQPDRARDAQRRERVADDPEGQREDAARRARDRPAGDDPADARGERAHDRADAQEPEDHRQDAVLAVEVAELAEDRRRDGCRQEERGQHPGRRLRPRVEVVGDRRQRREHHRLRHRVGHPREQQDGDDRRRALPRGRDAGRTTRETTISGAARSGSPATLRGHAAVSRAPTPRRRRAQPAADPRGRRVGRSPATASRRRVEAIAREAGVGMGTLYRRFACKDDLVRAILAERAEITLAEMAAGGRRRRPVGRARRRPSRRSPPGSPATRASSTRSPRRAGARSCSRCARGSWTRWRRSLADARAAEVVRDDVTVTDLVTLASIVDARAAERARGRRPHLGALPGVVLDGLRPAGPPLPRAPLPYEL